MGGGQGEPTFSMAMVDRDLASIRCIRVLVAATVDRGESREQMTADPLPGKRLASGRLFLSTPNKGDADLWSVSLGTLTMVTPPLILGHS